MVPTIGGIELIFEANKVDSNGLIIEPVLVSSDDALQSYIIATPVPEGLYIPKWTGESWIESATEEYKKLVDNPIEVPSETDILGSELDNLREEKKQSDLAILELSEYIMNGST